MKKSLLSAIAIAVAVFALSYFSPCRVYAQRGGKTTAPETYMVIKITDNNRDESKGEKKVEFKAISASQFKDEEKRAKEDYTKLLKEWHDLKKTGSTAPRPEKILIQKIITGFETQNIAADEAKKRTEEQANKDLGVAKPQNIKQ